MRVPVAVVLSVILISSVHAQDKQPRAVDELIAALHSPDQHVREEALTSLSAFGVTATDALVAALADQQISRDATVALGRIGPAVAPALIAILANPDVSLRRGAAVALGRIGGAAAETSVPSLITALGDPDDHVRAYAGWALGQIGTPASGTLRTIGSVPLAALISSLRLEDTRNGVVEALRQLGPAAGPALRSALSDSDPNVRQGAVIGLGKIAAVETSVPSLNTALSDPDQRVRQEAVDALGRIGQSGSPSSVIAPLTAALADAAPRVRAEAARCLSGLPPSSAASAVPALVVALGDQDEFVRRSASDTLRLIGPLTVPALIAALNDPRADVRRGAAKTLGGMRHPDEQVIPRLIAALEDPEQAVREEAAKTLSHFGPAAVPPLIAALGNSNPETRRLAAVALRAGPESSVPALVAALWDPDETVRHAAAAALENAVRIPVLAKLSAPPLFDPAIVQQTLDLAVSRTMKELRPGEIVYNPPDRMQVGVSEPITVRIARSDFEGDLKRDLVGRGVPFAAEIKVGTFVRVELGGPDFKINAMGDRDRVLPEGTMQEWRFDVLPLHAGKRRILDLLVSVRIHLPSAAEIPGAGARTLQSPASRQMVAVATKEELYSFPSFHREIAVDVNPGTFVRNLLADNWQYFLTGLATVTMGIAAFFGKRWFERSAEQRKPSSPARTKGRHR
jgi:HEAT repeat protein